MVEGRTYPVEDHFLPPEGDEELPQHVARAVEWVSELDERGDVVRRIAHRCETVRNIEGPHELDHSCCQYFTCVLEGDSWKIFFHELPDRALLLCTSDDFDENKFERMTEKMLPQGVST